MSHRKRTEVEDLAVLKCFKRKFFLFQHHIGTRIAVEREIAVAVFVGLDEGQSRVDFFVVKKIRIIDADISDRFS